MKRMHFAPPEVRARICQLLEKEGKELVHLSYGASNMDERRFYVGITYTPQNSNEGDSYSPNRYDANRYDVITYDIETDKFEYYSICLKYENALIQMGQCIETYT